MNYRCGGTTLWRGRGRCPETVGVTKTREQHQHHFARSVLRWLQAGYPDGVPAPDRLPLVALLRSTPLTEEQVQEVVRTITTAEGAPKDPTHAINLDEISHFISDKTHHDAGPENVCYSIEGRQFITTRAGIQITAASSTAARIARPPSSGVGLRASPRSDG